MTSPITSYSPAQIAGLSRQELESLTRADMAALNFSQIKALTETGIEALAGLSAHDREALFGDVWSQMWGMRNRIAHGYLLVEPAIVRSTVDRDLPVMVEAVRAAIDRLP